MKNEGLPALRPTLIAAFALVLYLSYQVIRPFLVALAVAGSFAILLHPLQQRLVRRIGGRPGVAAALSTLLLALVVLGPAFGYGLLLGEQAARVLEWARPLLQPEEVKRFIDETLPGRFPWINRGRDLLGLDDARLADLAGPAASSLVSGMRKLVQGAITGIASAVLQSILFLVLLFFFLRDGSLLAETLRKVLPLPADQEDAVFRQIGRTVKGVLLSMVVVPLTQGLLALAGFAAAGLPDAFFWAAVLVFMAVVPGIGATMVWAPAAMWLFFNRSHGAGIGIALYGGLLISTIDNIIKPALLREAARIHVLLGFLASLGGILAFGVMGFLLGPVVLSLLLSAIEIYRAHFGSETEPA